MIPSSCARASPAAIWIAMSRRLFELQTVVCDLLAQRFALDVLHRDVGPAFVFADFINRENVWMVQRRSGACFLKETATAIVLRDVLGREQFQRHDALQFVVVSFVDRAHAAGADRFDDPVMGNGFDGNRLHVFGVDDMMLNGDYNGNFP